MFDNGLEEGGEVCPRVVETPGGPLLSGGSVQHGKLELVGISCQLKEEVGQLLKHLVHPRLRAVHLVDDHDGAQVQLQRLLEHEVGLRHRALNGINDEQHPIRHEEHAFNLPAEVGVAWGVDNVDLHTFVRDGRVLRQDSDATLALLVV